VLEYFYGGWTANLCFLLIPISISRMTLLEPRRDALVCASLLTMLGAPVGDVIWLWFIGEVKLLPKKPFLEILLGV